MLENDTLLDLQALHQELLSNPSCHPDLKRINIILYKNGKLLLSQHSSLILTFFEKFHNTLINGHACVSTLSRLKASITQKA